MRLRLRDGDRPAGDGGPQGWLELAEVDLPLYDSAHVVLIEVEELQRARLPRGSRRRPGPPRLPAAPPGAGNAGPVIRGRPAGAGAAAAVRRDGSGNEAAAEVRT